MTNFPKTTRSILLVLGLLTSGSGCHVLSIPGNLDEPLGAHRLQGMVVNESLPSTTHAVEPHYYSMGGDYDGTCPPDWLSPLPQRQFVGLPVPKWWAEWRARKNLPEPPPCPRFHPLPTRPMFQPRP